MIPMPPKTPGEHRWIAVATYPITAGQASALSSGSSAVNLAPDRAAGVAVGCLDCEAQWPTSERCTAPAFDWQTETSTATTARVTAGATPDGEAAPAAISGGDLERMVAAIDAVGRTGAKAIETGYLDENVPAHLARWYATAEYRGAKVSADEHASPVDAAEALLGRLINGGKCVACGRRSRMSGAAAGVEGDHDWCVWSRVGDCWVPGCVTDVSGYVDAHRRHRAGPTPGDADAR